MRRPPNLMKSMAADPAAGRAAPPPPANYLDLYGLSKPPFGSDHDGSAFILFGSRRRAFELLVDHLMNGSGVVLLVGEEGTGKSEAVRSAGAVAVESGREIISVVRPVGGRVSQDTLAAALGALREPTRKAALIDDIDLLSEDGLNLLLTAAKQEPADAGSCPAVLVCSEAGLKKPGISDLAGLARNVVRLAALNSSEAQQYIERSLWMAGGTTRRLLTPDALKMLIARSGGIPATINRLMEATFNAGFARGDAMISAKTVAAAVGPAAPRQTHRSPPSHWFAGLGMQIAAIGLLVTGASVFLYRGFSEPPPPAPAVQPARVVPEVVAPAPKTPEPMSPDLMAALMKRGNESLDLGDVAAARLLFQRAAEAGNAAAATALGKTYDPRDPQKAAEWYRRAIALGDNEAAGLLQRLRARPKGS